MIQNNRYTIVSTMDKQWFLLFIFIGWLPIRRPAQCRMAGFPELDWIWNPAECSSFGCHGPPAVGRVWGGRNRWGSAPLLVQCFTGSPGFWTQAGPQLCRRGSQCPETDSSNRSQLLHAQLGQYKALNVHRCMHRNPTLWMTSKKFVS